MASARENLAPQVIQRVAREIRQLVKTPPNGICYLPQDEEVLTDIHVEIAGPENTPYDGGFFQVKLTLSDGFPHAPPKGVFLTKIFHPNIATNGEICVNTLKKDWTPALGIAHVLQVIRCLLIVPFPESSLNDEAGKLFMESYDEYARRAKLWTSIHAPKKSAAKQKERETIALKNITSKKPSGGVPTTTIDTENQDTDASVTTKVKQQREREPEASDDASSPTKAVSEIHQSSASTRVVTRVTTTITTSTSTSVTTGNGRAVLPLTKKRTSPTTMDALAAAQKKKSTLKKGIKRL